MQFNTLLGLAFLAAAALAAPLVEVRQCGNGGPYGGNCPPDAVAAPLVEVRQCGNGGPYGGNCPPDLEKLA